MRMILILALLTGCSTPRFINIIALKDDYTWQKSAGATHYELTITDHFNSTWFKGELSVAGPAQKKTFYIKGFEKANNHPTVVWAAKTDSTGIAEFFIWSEGRQADSVRIINDRSGRLRDIPDTLVLYKKRKN